MIVIGTPLPISAWAGTTDVATMPVTQSLSPREVWTHSSARTNLNFAVDFGTPVDFDMVYIGGALLPDGATWLLRRSTALGEGYTTEGSAHSPLLDGATGPRQHSVFFRPAGAPATRYYSVSLSVSPGGFFEIGHLLFCKVFRHPYAYGAGRQLIDTSRRIDLIDGGYGVEPGISKTGFRWRFVDLTDADREHLWQLTYDRGMRRPVVVVEDDGADPLPAASVHYGLFDKFEAWERSNAVDTQWALSMTEWR